MSFHGLISYEKSLISAQFCSKPKTALKKVFFKEMKWCYSYKKNQGELKESRRDKDLCSTYYLSLFYWVLRYSDEQNRHGPHPLRPFHVVQESVKQITQI